MLITCWSAKGGSGTTVVAAALAALLAADAGGALLVDLGGDLPAALGLPEPALGLADWVPGSSGPAERGRLGPSGPSERGRLGPSGPSVLGAPGLGGGLLARRGELSELEIQAGAGVRLLPRGSGAWREGVGLALVAALAGRDPVVVDAGTAGGHGPVSGPALDLASAATGSLLVLRPCFLALRRAVAAPLRPSGVVLVDEPQRVLGAGDVESALGVPVVAVVPWDPAVARRVDAGLLGAAMPRVLARALRRIAPAGPAGASWRPAVVR